jgi:hypothetical protein
MLGVAAGPQVGADDRQAVRRLRDRYLGVLQQELSAQGPLESAAGHYAAAGRTGP